MPRHRIHEDATNGVKYGLAMELTTQAEADDYFEDLVEHQIRISLSQLGRAPTREEAEAIERSNLCYFAGYHSHEVRARVERLFRTAHPFFGSIAENGPPTPEQAFQAGMTMMEDHLATEAKAQVPTIWDRLNEE